MADTHTAAEPHAHHVVPQSTYLKVFGALVALTILTVLTATQLDFGRAGNIIIALAIACAKATLVIAVFMGLKYSSRVNTLVFGIGIVMLMVFISITMLDTEFRGVFNEISDLPVREQERREEALRAREAALGGGLSAQPVPATTGQASDSADVDFAPGAGAAPAGGQADSASVQRPAP